GGGLLRQHPGHDGGAESLWPWLCLPVRRPKHRVQRARGSLRPAQLRPAGTWDPADAAAGERAAPAQHVTRWRRLRWRRLFHHAALPGGPAVELTVGDQPMLQRMDATGTGTERRRRRPGIMRSIAALTFGWALL